MAGEWPERLRRIRAGLLAETASQYWEFAPRGAKFSYPEPARCQHIDTLFGWLNNA